MCRQVESMSSSRRSANLCSAGVMGGTPNRTGGTPNGTLNRTHSGTPNVTGGTTNGTGGTPNGTGGTPNTTGGTNTPNTNGALNRTGSTPNGTGVRRRRHEECYQSSPSPSGSSGPSSPIMAARRSYRGPTATADKSRMGNGVRATHFLRSRVGSTGSGGGGDSPRSLPLDTPRLRGSPLRPSRQGNSSPGEDFSEDSGIRLDRTTHQDMFQDVISIKTMLLRLTRVLQETDQVNAFENSLNNGYYNLGNEGSQEDVTSQKKEIAEEISDLKRQVLFLQQQLEERDRTISTLQASVARLQDTRPPPEPTAVPDPLPALPRSNAATQTERGLPTDNLGGNLVSNSIETCTRPAQRQTESKSQSVSSRVPVGPWRKQTAQEQATRKLPSASTPLPQRRKAS